jgi:hypothetical protein
MTMQCDGTDYYDISMINAVNVGVSMTPMNSPAPNPAWIDPDYFCKAPGSPSPQGRNPGCSWDFAPSDPLLRLVTGGSGTTCQSDADCSVTGEVCGTGLVFTAPYLLDTVCGLATGAWTYDELCDWTNNAYGNCSQCTSL